MSTGAPASETAGTRWREWGLAAAALVPLALILARPLLPQDPKYHGLADTRTLIGIPNFGDVVSNIAFLLVGVAGLRLCLARHAAGAVRSWVVFFLGVALVSFGSVWYHWSPANASLVWDRLPMTIAFMGLFTAVLSEHAGLKLERVLLAPSVAAGVGSVAWWAWAGDLRPYIWVQGAPLICIVYVLIVYRGKYSHRVGLGAGFAAYALAKLAELHDHEIYALTARTVSGHTLKHLLAALGIFFVYLMLRRRKPISGKVPNAAE